jgi:hypothetical protein
MAQSERGPLLTAFAVGIALVGLSNLTKPLHLGETEGLVFFGQRLGGVPNLILAPLMAVFQFVYAYGIWTMRRFALPMAHAYATYVILNLILFAMRNPAPQSIGETIFFVVYAIVAIAVALGAAIVLTKRKAELH